MPLTLTPFPAGEHGFFRAPVLLSGATEALLVDGGFTLADGRAVAAAIRDSGKRLTTIYVSQSDPGHLSEAGARPFATASEFADRGVARDGGPTLTEASALASALAYTRGYLEAFEEELLQAADSGALIAAMKRRYPLAGMGVALDIGAKVAKGEMVWG